MTTELRELIHKLIDKKGRFQILLIVLIGFNSIEIGINHTVTSFYVYIPEYYCLDDPDKNTDPKSNCKIDCTKGYQFDETDDFSVAREFLLICDRKYLGPLVNTLYFVGVTCGSLICSTLCDLYGRRWMVIACMYMQALMSLGVYASHNLLSFTIFRMLQGFFLQGLQTCSYSLMIEYCPSRFRTMAGIFWELNWAAGLAILGIASYFVPNWRHLTLILLIPTAISLTYFWIIPESITWLYTHEHYNEALKLIIVVARKNNDTDLMEESNRIRSYPASERGMEPHEHVRLTEIVRNPILRKHLIVMIFVAFTVTMSYFGILFFLPKLGGPRHLNFLVGAAIEAVSYTLSYFVLSRFGRRIPMATSQFANMILITVMGILHAYINEDSTILHWVLNIISLIAKGIAVSCFCGMFMYSSELFPTACRGIGIGLCGFAARLGSLSAPQLMLLTEYVPEYVPLNIMSAFLLVSGGLILSMPETLSCTLPDTLEEAYKLWGKS